MAGNQNNFTKLEVWKQAMGVVERVYTATKQLPKEELFALVSQMRRAAISIPSNIAEGSKRGTYKDFTQFLRIALGSAAELETQMLLMQRLYGSIDVTDILQDIVHLQNRIHKLIQSLRA